MKGMILFYSIALFVLSGCVFNGSHPEYQVGGSDHDGYYMGHLVYGKSVGWTDQTLFNGYVGYQAANIPDTEWDVSHKAIRKIETKDYGYKNVKGVRLRVVVYFAVDYGKVTKHKSYKAPTRLSTYASFQPYNTAWWKDRANPQLFNTWNIQDTLLNVGNGITRYYQASDIIDVPVGEDGDIFMFTRALLSDNPHWIPEGMNFHVQVYQTGVWR